MPPSFVDEVMVSSAQRQQVGEVGAALMLGEPRHVVNLRVFEGHLAQRTRAVQHTQRPALMTVGQPCFAAEKQPHTIGCHHHRSEGAEARPPAHRLDRQPEPAQPAIDQRPRVALPVEERAEVDEHGDIGAGGLPAEPATTKSSTAYLSSIRGVAWKPMLLLGWYRWFVRFRLLSRQL